MHFLSSTYNITYERKLTSNNFLCRYSLKSIVRHACKTHFSGNARNELTDIDGKACNNIPEAVNKLALSACLGHSCETG